MIRALGIFAAMVFIVASLMGTAASGFFLGEALSPLRGGTIAGPLSLGMLLALVACAAEGLRFALALSSERIWRHSRFQAFALAGPLWLACTGYCTMIPLLALAFLPLFPTDADVLTVFAPAWALVQAAAGLLPGIAWAPAPPQARVPAAAVQEAPVPAITVVQRAIASRSPTSAEDLFRLLAGLSRLPAGSALSQRGRIGGNGEIVISQTRLATLVGVAKPTVRRWLQELERTGRIARRTLGKESCIVVQTSPSKHNGDAHPRADTFQPESRAA